jgi:hypothetical protein
MTTFDASIGAKQYRHDEEIKGLISRHIEGMNITHLEVLQLFPVLARRQELKRFIAHTDLFRLTLDVPGDILDLGVYRGASLMTWANLLEIFAIGDRTKRVIGLDNWTGFSELTTEDGPDIENAGKTVGGFDAANYRKELENAIRIFDSDRFVPWKDRVELVEGNIEQTLPEMLNKRPGLRFSLVHFDVDLYAPTRVALEHVWDKVPRGGVILFDEYGIEDWQGETQAVDEFLASRPEQRLRKLEWTNVPAAFLIKQ